MDAQPEISLFSLARKERKGDSTLSFYASLEFAHVRVCTNVRWNWIEWQREEIIVSFLSLSLSLSLVSIVCVIAGEREEKMLLFAPLGRASQTPLRDRPLCPPVLFYLAIAVKPDSEGTQLRPGAKDGLTLFVRTSKLRPRDYFDRHWKKMQVPRSIWHLTLLNLSLSKKIQE